MVEMMVDVPEEPARRRLSAQTLSEMPVQELVELTQAPSLRPRAYRQTG